MFHPPPLAPEIAGDLVAAREAVRSGATHASAVLDAAVAAAAAPVNRHTFTRTLFNEARLAQALTRPAQALAGLPFSVKDLFDVAGQPTPAGSKVLAQASPASSHASAVARLLAAGGCLIGRTNMSEFAYSGVGVNPHHGTPANACDSVTPRIPGGSSSGAAISVATGAAYLGLGSDTGGSIRIPAALNGLVGFKSTAQLVPLAGALPLSPTLDTVCAITRSVRDAVVVHEILAARRVRSIPTPLARRRLVVVRNHFLDDMEAPVASAFSRALRRLHDAGIKIESISLPPLAEWAALTADGGFAAVESYAWHRRLLTSSAAAYDPRVLQRILAGTAMKAHEYIDLLSLRQSWIKQMERALAPYDAVLSPTVPIVAPPLAEVAPGAERDAEFFRINGLLLRNPAVVNLMDGCAISIPCQAPGELPVGLMLWHTALHDDALLSIAGGIEVLLQYS